MGWFIFLGIVLLIAILLFMSVSVSIFIDEEIDVRVKYAGLTLFYIDSDEDPEKVKKKEEKKKAKAKKKEEKKKRKEEKERLKKEKKRLRELKKSGQADTLTEEAEEEIKADSEEATEGGEEKKKTPEEKRREKEQKKREKLAKKKKLEETIDLVKLLVKSAGKPVKRLISHIRINDLYIDITASGDDAAKAALNYGKINIAVHNLLAFLYQFVRLKVKEINIDCDFESGKTDFMLYCKVKMRISTALGCGIWFLFRMLKLSLQKNTAEQKTINQNTTEGTPSVNKKGK
ncbi:MAG: hypothetical protein IJF09_09595 [Ruminiclostridium sp.]|nr:hypothetical protein [Ruminiclostridium sp.]